jgi:hypothetical protein
LPTFTIGDASFPNLRDPGTDATQNYRQGFVSGNQFLSSDIALVSPGGDGSDLPTPPRGDDDIVDDGGGLCFQPGTPLLDAPIDNQAGTCGTTSRCETGNCCSLNGFCGPPTLGFCENNIADYRTVACSSISNPNQELVQYEDVDNCIQVFCGDILSICTGDANCAAEWADIDERLNNRQNVCGSGLSVDSNFAKYSLQCSCDNCGALISQLAGEEKEGLDIAVVAGACVGVLFVGGLVIGGFIYAKKGASPNRPLAASTSTELTPTKSSIIFGRKSRGKSWLDGTDVQSVV